MSHTIRTTTHVPLMPGSSRPRVPKGHSQAHAGISPISSLTHRTQSFQKLPIPLGDPPYRLSLATSLPHIEADAAQKGYLIFHTVGDTGGIKHPDYQRNVASAMKGDLNLPAAEIPSFFYHLGDVVYYNGQPSEYYSQFYEPYDHYTAPIFAIPGNHDGDPIDSSQTSLDGWVAYFMTQTPHVDPLSADAPRVTMSQPNVYFTLDCPFVTIIGMYTNVPEHGSIDSVQQQWLTNEFHEAPKDKALILALHHPIYSFDDHHSGSPTMADAVQHAINDSRRVPNLVLTAHVHNYQRIEKPIVANSPTPFIVAGLGGYYHLHGMNEVAGFVDPTNDVALKFENHLSHGYLTLKVDAQHITGSLTLAEASDKDPQNLAPKKDVDTFQYSAGLIQLPANAVISL